MALLSIGLKAQGSASELRLSPIGGGLDNYQSWRIKWITWKITRTQIIGPKSFPVYLYHFVVHLMCISCFFLHGTDCAVISPNLDPKP